MIPLPCYRCGSLEIILTILLDEMCGAAQATVYCPKCKAKYTISNIQIGTGGIEYDKNNNLPKEDIVVDPRWRNAQANNLMEDNHGKRQG